MSSSRLAAFSLLLGLVTACDSADDDGADSAPAADAEPPDDGAAQDRCERILDAPEGDRAGLELVDGYAEEEVLLEVYVDDCRVESPGGAFKRGLALGVGFLAGERTVRIVLGGEELPPQSISTAPGDLYFVAIEPVAASPRLFSAKGSRVDPPAGSWRVYLMNMSGVDMTMSRAVEPDAEDPAYEPLAELAYGESFAGELPVGQQRGAPIRVELDGNLIFDDNVGFNLSCDPGEWTGGLTMFALFDDEYLRVLVVYPDDPCRAL